MDGELRPRERYLREGPAQAGEAELLALILGTGRPGRPVLALAGEILSRVGGLSGLASSEPAELAAISGMGPARAVRVHAAIALGARSVRGKRPGRPVIDAASAFGELGPGLCGLAVEELHALYVDRALRPIALQHLTRGSDAFTVVDPRQVLRPAIQLAATGVVLAHNHPSGDPSPSEQDRAVTRRVAAAARIVGVRLLDHLVVAGGRHRSLAADGELPPWADEPTWTA